MAAQNLVSRMFGDFHRTFWVVNAFELFERGAYYGTMAVLGVHVVKNLFVGDDYARALWGTLYSFLIILLYFLPLISAAVADKIGYRNMLLAAFSLMVAGYTSLSMVRPGQFGFLVFSFTLVGFGAGMFKPIISASIAHVTEDEQRNLAYSIYYWMINLGAAVFPFVIGVFFPSISLYYYVFLISTGLVAVNIVILMTMYKNPVDPRPELNILQAIMRIKPALQDKRFVILLTIYAGFWFMFAFNHTFLPVMMVDFGRMPLWFTAPFLAVVNPLTIIIAGPVLAKWVEKRKSLNVMMFGMVIFCIGFALNGLSNVQSLFIAGIVVFSIGEFIVHPGFISYVSKIAPRDKIAIYLASIFVSTGLGQLVGGAAQGFVYNEFAYMMERPKMYTAFVLMVGLLTLAAFMVYNKWITKEQQKDDPTVEDDTSVWSKSTTMAAVLLLIPITYYGAWLGGTNAYVGEGAEGEGVVDWADFELRTDTAYDRTGMGAENLADSVEFFIEARNVANVTFTLTWTDEPDQGFRYTNQPDEFALEVFAPNATEQSTGYETDGSVSLRVSYPRPDEEPYFNGTGAYQVSVLCGVCGDQTPLISIGGFRDVADDSNAYLLVVEYEFYARRGL